MSAMRYGLFLPVFMLAFTGSIRADEALEHSVRDAIGKAVPYIEERGQWWIDEKKCVSCHRISFMTWSLLEARGHGVAVDDAKLADWQQWSHEKLLAINERAKVPTGALNQEGVSEILWSERNLPPPEGAAVQDKLIELVLNGRQESGLWKANGQLPSQKRPKDETVQVSSLWSLLALTTVETPAAEETLRSGAETAAGWPAGVSTEWYALQLILAHQLDDADRAAQLSRQLRERQRDDGSWSWGQQDESDAMGTAQALYALKVTGAANDDPAVRRGIEWLLTAQQKSGAWLVHGTKANKKDADQETAGYWGTCWVVIALSQVLPPASEGTP